MHVCKYINSSQEGIVIEEENVLSYYDREIIYQLIMNTKDKRKHIEVAGFKTSNNNKRRLNGKRKTKFVELIEMNDRGARKEITEEVQKKHGGLPVFFWSLP